MGPYRQKVGLYTLGVALILLGGAYILRNSAYAYLWNPSVIGAGLLIVLGLEFIITKMVVDHHGDRRMGVSVFSIIVLTLLVLSLFGVGTLSQVFDGTSFTRMLRWGITYQDSGTPVYDESLSFSAEEAAQLQTVILKNDIGNITLLPSSDQTLHARVGFYASTYRQAPSQTVLPGMAQREGDTLRLSIHQNERVDITLYIPPGLQRIELENSAGRVEASGVDVNLTVKNALGEVMISDISGTVQADTSGGQVEIRDIDGDVDVVRASMGSVKVQKVSGSASVSSDAGDITLDTIGAAATARVSMGNATLRSINGDVDAQVNTGNLSIQSSGAVKASVNMGNLTYTAINPDNLDLNAHARFGQIEAASLYGSPTREATSQSLKVTLGDGSVDVHLSANTGNITLKY